jgi:site-specific recombinase XerD
VRKGKGYKERFVPVAQKNFDAIRLYIDFARLELLHGPPLGDGGALFIAARKGVAMNRQSLYHRVKTLVRKAGIKKNIGTHTLRHSIATHLLQNCMKLERIKEFLGHADLDSTQIYTHIVNPQPPKGGKENTKTFTNG